MADPGPQTRLHSPPPTRFKHKSLPGTLNSLTSASFPFLIYRGALHGCPNAARCRSNTDHGGTLQWRSQAPLPFPFHRTVTPSAFRHTPSVFSIRCRCSVLRRNARHLQVPPSFPRKNMASFMVHYSEGNIQHTSCFISCIDLLGSTFLSCCAFPHSQYKIL